MAAIRKAIKATVEGRKHVARFRHPLRKDQNGNSGKLIRIDLGSDATWRENLAQLNRIFLNESLWRDPPADTSKLVREIWLGVDDVLSIDPPGVIRKGAKTIETTQEDVIILHAENERLQIIVAELNEKILEKDRIIKALEVKKGAKIAFPTLQEARDSFMASYTKKDSEHTLNVGWDLDRFVKKFGASRKIDDFQGRENEINAWLHSLKNKDGKPISDSRLSSIAIYVLKLLKINGVELDKSKIDKPTKTEIQNEQELGNIVALTVNEAKRLIEALPPMFADAFRIQCRVGLRPDELLTLCRKNFENEFSVLKLSRLEHLTIKNKKGRIIPIPADLRPIIKARADGCDVLFPEPASKEPGPSRARDTGKLKRARLPADGRSPWRNPKAFDRQYKKALVKAAIATQISKPMDCRIGRRTCSSLLGNAGVSADRIAKLLGNSSQMINEHYWNHDLMSLDLSATVIQEGQKATS